MPRIRTIKPDYWTDWKLAKELDRDQRLFYVGLWNEADDEGRLQAHPRRLLGAVFPYEEDLDEGWATATIEILIRTGRAVVYTVSDEPYLQLTKFGEHQKINRPSESRIPPPDSDLARIHDTLMDPSLPAREEVEGEREEEEERDISSPDGDSSKSAGADPEVPMEELWRVFVEELGGDPPHPRLTRKRRGRLGALFREQLRRHEDPVDLFRRVMKAVKRSDWHMKKRDYQMPESLFLNQERRDNWVQKALEFGRGPPRSGIGANQGRHTVEGDENAA